MHNTTMAYLLRILLFAALCGASVANAQVYCSPSGFNVYGQPCDPNGSQGYAPGGQQQPMSPGSGYPGQMPQQSGPPVISNRAPGGTAPVQPGQYPFPPQYPGQYPSGQYPGVQPPGVPYPGVQEPGFPQIGPRDFQDAPFARFAPRERNEFQDFVLQSVGRDLPMFGYGLFQGVPTTFAPVDRVPVTPDYVVGPGDEIMIRAWGAVDIDYRAIVDRNGAISIPKIGTISVAGVRFADLQPHLKNAIGRVFRNFELNVSLGQLRSLQIFVVGQAMRPGAYTVSSLSTLVNALFASGGPTVKGSMRSIQLKRRDKLVTEFDVYDLLLKGDKSKDVQLLPGDVIYIPPIGPLAAISGSVNNPAIYELKGEKTLAALIDTAGGLATTADGQKVTVERIVERRSRQVEEFNLDKEGLANPVRSGDLVVVQQLSPRFDNAVTVRGNVAVPARHPWRSGIRVRDVVPDKEALIVPDYWVKRNLAIRPDVTGRETYGLRPELAYDLRQGSTPDASRPGGAQQPWDNRPGSQPDGRHGGASSADVWPGAQLWDNRGLPRDGRQNRAQQLRTEIKQQLPEVNWEYAVVERLDRDKLTTQLIPFNLAKAVIEGDPQNNLALQPGDVITIFSKNDIQVPVAQQTQFVRLEGEVRIPGVYQILPGETLRQLIARVGGFSPNAYVYGAEFTRETVRVQQQKRLDEALDRLAQEIERNAATRAQGGLDAAEVAQSQAQAENHRRLLARLREVKATGRVVLDINPEQADMRSLPELALEDGDRLLVPAKPSTVGVVGAVYNQNSFIHDPGKRVSDYLEQAGGGTREADSGRVYVVRADGSVTGRAAGLFSGRLTSERLNPGDTIVVPENLDRFRLTKELKDWSQIFYQFALGVAGLKVLQDL